MKKPELLAPAGNMECLKAAIEAGADAVYIGGKHFGARNFAQNFTDLELIEAINYAHLYGVKIYVTVNTMITEELVKPFIKYVDFLHQNNVDAVIVSDIGMMDYLRRTYPNLEIHASTQMHIHNLEGAKFVEELGLKRTVLARETNIETIKNIKENTNIELEIFVHGALCISYSGQCLMSSLIGGRSGNKGTCSQSCRMKYDLIHESRKVNKDNYLLSTKDLNTLEFIGELIEIGVDSLKIEGRMKSLEYVYFVTSLYRKAIDSYINNKEIKITEEEIKDLKKIFNREYTKGFLNNEDNSNFVNQYRPNHQGIKIGKVISEKNKFIKIKLEDNLNVGDGIRILNKEEDYGLTVLKMKKNKEYLDHAFKGDVIELKLDKKVLIGDVVLKTSDINLIKKIENNLKENKRKVLIDAKIELKLNKPIKMSISDGKNYVEIESTYLVEESIKSSTTKDRIIEQLEKLGNTVYKYKNLEIDIDDNIFVNIKELNEIRRNACILLNEKRTYKIPYRKQEYKLEPTEYIDEVGYTYLIHNIDMYDKLSNAKEIIVDDIDLYNKLINDDRVTLKIPRVINKYNDYNIKVMIGEMGSIKKYKNKISDFSFNASNSYAVAFLHSNNVSRVTLSIELNEEQINKIVENYKERYKKSPNLEVIVSYTPESMISKFNLIKYYNLPNNDNYLIDKFRNRFKIKIKDDLMYIYHFKKIEIENHKKLFSIGINRLRIEIDE